MKRGLLLWIVSGIAAGLGIAGCTIQPEQISVIAQNAGLFSAVSWIAMDNPTTNEINAVKEIVVIIGEKASGVQEGKTYSEVVYPEVEKIIDTKLEEKYRPLAKTASISILGGLDMLFATHPEWKSSQDIAIKVVNSFVFGAKNGLNMKADDPVIVNARAVSARRAKIIKN